MRNSSVAECQSTADTIKRTVRLVVEEALCNPDWVGASNNELHHHFRASIGIVRELRRRLECNGQIPRVLLRRGRNGRLVDCSRVIDPPWLGRQDGQPEAEQ